MVQAGKACKATGNHSVTLLPPPECGKLDYRQRCRFRCCLAPRWRRSLLTAFGANCQGISAEKSCLQVFSAPLDYWQGGNTSKLRSGEHKTPPNPHEGQEGARTGRRAGERNGGSGEAQRPKAGGHQPRAADTHPLARAKNFAKFLVLRRFSFVKRKFCDQFTLSRLQEFFRSRGRKAPT